jgi:hypothetical protein
MSPFVKTGDLVRLVPRERPFTDDPYLWWTVTKVTPTGLDAHWQSSTGSLEWRLDVAFASVKAVKFA